MRVQRRGSLKESSLFYLHHNRPLSVPLERGGKIKGRSNNYHDLPLAPHPPKLQLDSMSDSTSVKHTYSKQQGPTLLPPFMLPPSPPQQQQHHYNHHHQDFKDDKPSPHTRQLISLTDVMSNRLPVQVLGSGLVDLIFKTSTDLGVLLNAWVYRISGSSTTEDYMRSLLLVIHVIVALPIDLSMMIGRGE